ncbi:sensor domain-containing diguanylate cyclase [Fusibacter ferrireducens]|uniref:GGDEF domain-containing protein n=1 Tax=Fusibacter ferrireducens TaxID=2785058 RepID=A0ABR9ZMJ3_9FIRM|nr:GGDEF domain-containing protein [Fusibacter ferrireducens]MBF4691536.1 GGDEF domain-containing protein [Fusibacter ferrireducens]
MILNKAKAISILFSIVLFVFLGIIGSNNYLLFHSISEIFSICIAFTIFSITWNSKEYIKNNFLMILGIAYLFIGILDLLHTLSYKGMNIFTDYDYYANQVWIATRFLESITIFISFIILNYKKKINTYVIFAIYLIVTTAIMLSIFNWRIFPICFIEGVGLTPFKVISEYIISLILIISLACSRYYKNTFDKLTYNYIAVSILFTILSELAFTFYVSNYGFSNMIGHFFKIISFYCIYKALIEKGIKEPNYLIFKELQNQVDTDGLTGLFNHRYLYDKLEDEIRRTLRTKIRFSVIIFDVDHFKNVNDQFGHLKGDEVLVGIAKVMSQLTRNTDVVGRYGGEEFMVILPDTDINSAFIVAEKVREGICQMDLCGNGTKVTISAGIAEFSEVYVGDEVLPIPTLAANLVDAADQNLYKAKTQGRNITCGLDE